MFSGVVGKARPNMFNNLLNRVDKGTTAYGVAKFDPTVMLAGHKPLFVNEMQAEYNVTNLNNGFTVLTETSTFPSAVNMGKFSSTKRSSHTHLFWDVRSVHYMLVQLGAFTTTRPAPYI